VDEVRSVVHSNSATEWKKAFDQYVPQNMCLLGIPQHTTKKEILAEFRRGM